MSLHAAARPSPPPRRRARSRPVPGCSSPCPLLGAAILLLGGRRTDKWGHWLAVGLSWASFVVGRAAVPRPSLAGARGARPRPVPVRLDPRRLLPARAPGCCSTRCRWPSSCSSRSSGSLIHVYSVAYMEHDTDRRRFFALPQPVRRGDAAAGPRRLLPAAVRRLGGRGSRVVPADRVLEPQPGLRRRGEEGVRRQPGRRLRPLGRHHDHVRDVRHGDVQRRPRRRGGGVRGRR